MKTQKIDFHKELLEDLAIKALTFLAADMERLGRFCSLTGIGPQNLREASKSEDFFISVLQYLRQDEALLIEFCNHSQTTPKQLSLFHDENI